MLNISIKREFLIVFGIAIVFGILLSYPISVASGVMIFLASEFVMNSFSKSCVVCLVLVGAMCGILGGGFVADRYGRKKAIFFAAMFLFFGSLFSVLAHTFYELLFFRFLVGVGIGISSMVVPIYLAEIALPKYRGKMVSLYQVAITLGILLSYLTNLCLFQIQSWRIALGVSAVFAFFALILIYFMPESPSWLISKGDVGGGRDLLLKFYPQKEAEEIIHKTVESKKHRKHISFARLFHGGLKKALLVGVLLSIFQQITGINAVICFTPEIFHHAGITNLCGKFLATTLLGILNVATALFAMNRIDRLGRRTLLLIGIPGMILSLLILALFFNSSIASIIGLLLYIMFFGISLGPVVWVLTAEIFPLEIRGKAVSVALFTNWVAQLFVSWFFLFIVEMIGIGSTFYLFALTSLAAFLFVYFFVPETKRKTLEEIQEYWQKSN
jgi:SP family galactose:H+ symporter-like MFS transporter